MPLYHATTADRLPSILKSGLGGGKHEQRWEGAERGTYLSSVPEICIWVMVEGFMRFAPDDASPRDDLAQIRVIVIDDSRYDVRLLRPETSWMTAGLAEGPSIQTKVRA